MHLYLYCFVYFEFLSVTVDFPFFSELSADSALTITFAVFPLVFNIATLIVQTWKSIFVFLIFEAILCWNEALRSRFDNLCECKISIQTYIFIFFSALTIFAVFDQNAHHALAQGRDSNPALSTTLPSERPLCL